MTSYQIIPSPKKSAKPFHLLLASAFGLGLSPIAPGTCGALFGVVGHISIVKILPSEKHWIALVLFFLAVCIVHFILTPWAIEYWHSKDPAHFVLDEVAGYLVVPILFRTDNLWYIVISGFVLFRLFDIIKLPGARYIDQQMTGPWGILLDDIISALYAVATLYLVQLGRLLIAA